MTEYWHPTPVRQVLQSSGLLDDLTVHAQTTCGQATDE
jgi:hypothetical protein